MLRLLLALGLAASAVPVSTAHADDCSGRSVEHVRADGAPADLQVAWNDGPSTWELRDGASVHRLSAIPEHAHLAVLVARDGTVAVVRTSAGHDRTDRVLVYDRSGHLLARHDIDGLLPPAGARATSRSISHLQWVRGWRFVGERAIELRPMAGPPIRVTLERG